MQKGTESDRPARRIQSLTRVRGHLLDKAVPAAASWTVTGVLAALSLVLVSTRLIAQELEQPKWLTVSGVQVDGNKDELKIKVTGQTQKVPSGTRIEFQLCWRSQTIEKFTHVSEGTSFATEFKLARSKAPMTGDPCYFNAVIRLEDQKASAKNELAREKSTFPAELAPWTLYLREKSFALATKEEIAEEEQQIRNFFMTRILKSKDLLLKLEAAALQAANGEDYDKDGALDEKSWRTFVEKEVYQPIRDMQKELVDLDSGGRFRPYRSALGILGEFTRTVAALTLQGSIGLYKSKGLEPSSKDTKAEEHELETNTKQRHIDKGYLEKLYSEILAKIPKEQESAPKPGAPQKGGGS